jgi:MarR family transcriptional regulator, 2-MHQ and catechol-resistance regulon repressor
MTSSDLTKLADALNRIATLYQFRSIDTRLYGALTVSQSYCLRILYFAGDRTMSELASALAVRLSTITGVIDQLERKKLVTRTDHPTDRRSLQVRLTTQGRTLYRSAHEAFLSHLKPLLSNRTPAEREGLLSFLGDVEQSLRHWQKSASIRAKSHGK